MKFNIHNQPNDMISSMHYDVLNITLVTVELENNNKGNLTSELYVLANHSMFGKSVYCGDGRLMQQNSPNFMIMKKVSDSLYYIRLSPLQREFSSLVAISLYSLQYHHKLPL